MNVEIYNHKYMNQYHYNYIYTGDTKWGEVFFSDLFRLGNFKYFRTNVDNFSFFQRLLFMSNYSSKIRRIIGQPFRRFVNKKMFYHKFENGLPVCVIFQGNKAKFFNDPQIIQELRTRNPDGKLVLYMIDLVSKNKELDPEYANRTFDLVVSYDKNDADKYGWLYIPTPFSKVSIDDNKDYPNTDIYFCGSAKERLNELLRIYDFCNRIGLRCNFYLPDEVTDETKQRSGIHYATTMTYRENLARLNKAKCNLELMQEGAVGFTPRLWESIAYDKHLITNNKIIINSPYYCESGIHMVNENLDSIGKWINEPMTYPSSIKALLSPRHFLEIVDTALYKISK